MSRTPLVAANLKMHKTIAEAERYVQALLPRVATADGVDVVVCPPYTALGAIVDSTRGSRVAIYAQNAHHEDAGAYTGEISPPMLTEIGVHGAIVGHSERRRLDGETNAALAKKVPALLASGLVPMLCVGETEEERDAGEMERTLRHQVHEALGKTPKDRLPEVVIAYEPVWAIGTGRTATAAQAQEAIGFVRALVGSLAKEAAAQVRILYGGSVKESNAAELFALPDVDGGLVGGASLEPEPFAEIVAAATPAR